MEQGLASKQGLTPVLGGKSRRYADYYRNAYAQSKRDAARRRHRWFGSFTAPHGRKTRAAQDKARIEAELAARASAEMTIEPAAAQ